jgi:hypothetical protein
MTRAASPTRTSLVLRELEARVVPSYFPATTNGIHVLEDQLPGGLSDAMLRFVATHTDGTQKETLAATDQFRAINPDYTVLHYQLGTGNSAYDYILNDQWANDFAFVTQHEDWFAHQTYSGEPQSAADLASGRVLGNGHDWYQADIANPTWQQYTLTQVLQNMAATGSNAWFADSFTYGIGGAGYNDPVPARYQGTNAADPANWPGGITWTDQLGNWVRTIEAAFAQHNAANGTDYKFLPNLDGRATSWEPDWYSDASGVPVIDGAFLEGFGQYTDTYNWSLSMNRGLDLTHNGKIVVMQPYPSASPDTAAGQQQIDFFVGTYLLLKGDQTYLNIDYGGGVQYYPQYRLDLGAAAAPPPADVSAYLWNGVYRRDFQNGFVLVNPGDTAHTLALGSTYRKVQGHGGGTMTDADLDASGHYTGGTLTYQSVNNVTLAGGTAAVFLKPTSTPITVATPAHAAANPVRGTAVGLAVRGLKNGSGLGLTYTWSATGPAAVTFTRNGTTAARNTTARFAQAGTYVLTATISDGAQSVQSSVTVTVNQTFTRVQVNPATATVSEGGTRQFGATALDQFGHALLTQPAFTWSVGVGGRGTIDASGLYSAPAAGVGAATVRARSGLKVGTARVTLAANGTAAFVGTDTTHQGNWQGAYGSDGADVAGASPVNPSYATVTPRGALARVWTRTTSDVRALADAAGGRVAAAWYSATRFNIDVHISDGQPHRVSLYFLDWDHAGRSERVEVLDSAGHVLDSRTVSGSGGGQYLSWTVSGNVTFRITRLAGPSAVVSGLFFDAP